MQWQYWHVLRASLTSRVVFGGGGEGGGSYENNLDKILIFLAEICMTR